MIKIEYWNTYNIIDVAYETTGYKNRFWLDVDVKKPEYAVEQEAYENGNGESIPTFIKWSKKYQFEIYCLEPLVDAITTIPLHDNVYVQLANGYEGKVKEFTVNPTWTEIDNVCKCTVSFVVATHNVNGGKATGCI